ncbi:Calpain-type cysteine protease DEK1 [Capsicum baccatum]|uniref:Calpain-type cysteine protease DEK1 n=1 Tax=Capsicum baccatum TaxID=33114 RepID=A0A2G2V1W4_CAPBA|nr:Calpain-type cysteine protease DEK1 [Capsicum baccatum]
MGRSQLICTGGSLMVTVQYSNDYKDDKNEALHTQYIFRTDVPHGDLHFMLQAQGSASWTSIFWFTCSTSCVFYPVWSDSKGIKLAWGYNINCRDNPWYFGHCINYAVVASVLLGAAVSRHLSVTDPLAARRDALQSTVIYLREGFRRKDQNSSASSSEGCGSSIKRSSSADAGHLGNATVPCTGDGSTWNNIEGINSDKSIDSGRPSLALRSSSCRSVVQEPEVGSSYVDRNLEHNSSLVVCSSSGLESQGGDSSTSASANQQILDFNLALAFQEKLSDPRITSMLKRKGRHTDRELANLLQDKGLDANFTVMLKDNGLDPMILALLQRSSLDADREHRDSNPPVTDSNDVEDVLPNHISFSEELRLQGLGKWLQRCRIMLHHVAGTPERAWLLFSLIFILETVVVAIF